MSWRRFQVVLVGLPADSLYKTALRDQTDLSTLPPHEPGKHGIWSQTDLLLAGIGDLLRHWLWMNADPKTRPSTPPPPLRRPGVEETNVRPISPAAAAYLRYLAEHHGAAPPDDWEPEIHEGGDVGV